MTRLHRYRARCPFWAIADAPVWYSVESGAQRVAAIIDGRPWFAVGKATWMARLRNVQVPGSSGLLRIRSVEVADLAPRREDHAP